MNLVTRQKALLLQFQQIYNEVLFEKMPLQRVLLQRFQPILAEHRADCKAKSLNYNIFSTLRPKEPKISAFLGDLLNPHGSHDQDRLFLDAFLQKLGIEDYEKGYWQVDVEKGNIDILLKRSSPPAIVIIESKSNYASDQENQLYRYYYRHIYNRGYHPSNAQIVYMPRLDYYAYSQQTVSRPYSIADTNAPETVPKELIATWGFNKEVIDWLDVCKQNIEKENHRLHTIIHSFQDYLAI